MQVYAYLHCMYMCVFVCVTDRGKERAAFQEVRKLRNINFINLNRSNLSNILGYENSISIFRKEKMFSPKKKIYEIKNMRFFPLKRKLVIKEKI